MTGWRHDPLSLKNWALNYGYVNMNFSKTGGDDVICDYVNFRGGGAYVRFVGGSDGVFEFEGHEVDDDWTLGGAGE